MPNRLSYPLRHPLRPLVYAWRVCWGPDRISWWVRFRLFFPRFRQLKRVATTASASTLTTVFGLVAILIPVSTAWLNRQADVSYLLVAAAAILFFGLILLATLVTSYFSLRNLPPQRYAETRLATEDSTTVLTILAAEIHRCCRRFLLRTRDLREVNRAFCDTLDRVRDLEQKSDRKRLKGICNAIARRKDEWKLLLWEIERHMRRDEAVLQRLVSLKMEASRILDIPHLRLCDHVVEYSPTVHASRTTKIHANWTEIVRLAGQYADRPAGADQPVKEPKFAESRGLLNRFKGLFYQSRSILKTHHKRIEKQSMLLSYRNLLHWVHAFNSDHSTSEAVLDYAHSIAAVANLARKKKLTVTQVEDRLAFLARKQRGHPGFDLNYLCMRLCSADHPVFGASMKIARDAFELLSSTKNVPEEKYEKLESLGDELSAVVADQREAIAQQFRDLLSEQEHDKTKVIYATHSYSKTVREVIKKSADVLEPLFIVSCGDEDILDCRIMLQEIREQNRYRESRKIGVCDDKLLPRLLARGWELRLLLGAEFVDKSDNVLHPRGLGKLEQLRQLVERDGGRLRVIVVAGRYKRADEGLSELLEYYRGHLYKLQLYPHDQIDHLVTDEGFHSVRGRAVGEARA